MDYLKTDRSKERKPYTPKTARGENTARAIEVMKVHRYHKPAQDWSYKAKHAEASPWRVLDPSEY
jgi:hypothetical protein